MIRDVEDAQQPLSYGDLSVDPDTPNGISVAGHRDHSGNHQLLACDRGGHAQPPLQRIWGPGLPAQANGLRPLDSVHHEP